MVAQSLLTSLELPLHSVAEIAVNRALIVAPHPDSETLCDSLVSKSR
jgi:hypothetical protein